MLGFNPSTDQFILMCVGSCKPSATNSTTSSPPPPKPRRRFLHRLQPLERRRRLDQKSPASVLYVNFGSITILSSMQLLEFAWGLANTNRSFLWVVRPDLVQGETAVLPADYCEKIQGRGLMVGWCSQERVLAHPAVGGFLTHCRWNSTIESLAEGVPMICWPFFAEQQTNCRYACVNWGVGVEMEGEVRREKVAEMVEVLMEGKEMSVPSYV